MAWYKCDKCGHLFEDGEQEFNEDIGMWVCPVCSASYKKVYRCNVCGEFFEEHEGVDTGNGNVCDKCIDSYRHDAKAIKEVADDTPVSVKLNVFLAEQFTREEIESILLNELLKRKDADYKEFLDNDPFWFAEEILRLQ